MAPGTNVTLIAGLALAILATVICIVSTAIPYWINNSAISGHVGLWQRCVPVCEIIVDAVDWMQAIRAMMVISLLNLVSSSCFAFIFAFMMRTRTHFATFSAILAFVGGVLAMVGAIVYAAKSAQGPSLGFSLHAGFGLAIVAAVIAFAAGVTLLLGKRQADTMY